MRHAFFAVFATSMLWAAAPQGASAAPAPRSDLSEQRLRHQVSASLAALRKTLANLSESAKTANDATLRKMGAALKAADEELSAVTDPHGFYGAVRDLNLTLGVLQSNLRTLKPGQAKRIMEGVGAINGRLGALVDPKVVEQLKRRKAEGLVKGRLGDIRQALIRYKRDMGKFPKKIKALVKGGRYLRVVPFAMLSEHERSRKVRVLKEVKDQAALDAQVKDTGQWLYVADPESDFFGTVKVDCTHTDSRGMRWNGY